jgi:hypothetical protein
MHRRAKLAFQKKQGKGTVMTVKEVKSVADRKKAWKYPLRKTEGMSMLRNTCIEGILMFMVKIVSMLCM